MIDETEIARCNAAADELGLAELCLECGTKPRTSVFTCDECGEKINNPSQVESDTPRVEDEIFYAPGTGRRQPIVSADFVRALERELAAAKAELEAVSKQFASSKAKRAIEYIERICPNCGHARGPDDETCLKCSADKLAAALEGCSNRLRVVLAEAIDDPVPTFDPPAPSALENIRAVAAALSAYREATR